MTNEVASQVSILPGLLLAIIEKGLWLTNIMEHIDIDNFDKKISPPLPLIRNHSH